MQEGLPPGMPIAPGKHVATLMPHWKVKLLEQLTQFIWARAKCSGWSIAVRTKASKARRPKGPKRRFGKPAHPGGARWGSVAGLEPEFGDRPPGRAARSRGMKDSASEAFIVFHWLVGCGVTPATHANRREPTRRPGVAPRSGRVNGIEAGQSCR